MYANKGGGDVGELEAELVWPRDRQREGGERNKGLTQKEEKREGEWLQLRPPTIETSLDTVVATVVVVPRRTTADRTS